MAYVSKEDKAKFVKALKEAFPGSSKDRGFKYTISVRHFSTIVCTISEGTVDFFGSVNEKYSEFWKSGYSNVNQFQIESQFKASKAKEILMKIKECLNIDNYNNSDVYTDYHDVGHYIEINIGKWDKPYRLIEKKEVSE